MSTVRLHASVRRDEVVRADLSTCELRVPLSLFAIDENRGDVDLVLSRAEADKLLWDLAAALRVTPEPVR